MGLRYDHEENGYPDFENYGTAPARTGRYSPQSRNWVGHADISTAEVYVRADSEPKQAALEKAAAYLNLRKASHWEQDTELIERLTSLGWLNSTYYAQ